MLLVPSFTYTLVSPLHAEQNLLLLSACTKHVDDGEASVWIRNNNPLHKFKGKIDDGGKFNLIPSAVHSQNYQPSIEGEVVNTLSGSLVFVRMKPLRGSVTVFVLAIIVTLVSFSVLLATSRYAYGVAVISFFLLSSVVAFANFRMHARRSYSELLTILDLS